EAGVYRAPRPRCRRPRQSVRGRRLCRLRGMGTHGRSVLEQRCIRHWRRHLGLGRWPFATLSPAGVPRHAGERTTRPGMSDAIIVALIVTVGTIVNAVIGALVLVQ